MRALALRVTAPVLALLLAACAGGSTGVRSFESPLGVSRDIPVENRREMPLHSSRIRGAPEALAEEVPAIYRYLGLDAAAASSGDPLTFFTPPMTISGLLYEGERNSDYIDCGSAMQGKRADLYEVRFALVTRLAADGEETLVQTRLEGLARDRYTNEAPVVCGGTGKLEGEIAELLRRGGVG